MTTAHLADDMEREEGREHEAYPDPQSPLGLACAKAGLKMRDYRKLIGGRDLDGAPWTIGCGHTGPEVHPGLTWTDAQIDGALADDIQRAADGLDRAVPWWRKLSDPREDVLVQMAFQMGVAGVQGFRNTLGFMRLGAFDKAADGMLASLWARQTPQRAARLAKQMRTGVR